MEPTAGLNFAQLYAKFEAPIAALDCGTRCAPYNGGVPFCCDTHHAVPTAYPEEWLYLQKHTDLWHQWQDEDVQETQRLAEEAGELVLIACKGHLACQRGFRSLVCRAFPFFPYINLSGEFIGMSYYWEYRERCWVINNLQVVTPTYASQFIQAYDALFKAMPDEIDAFSQHSRAMRLEYGRQRKTIPLIGRDGTLYKISPVRLTKDGIEQMQSVPAGVNWPPKYGPYQISDRLLFPNEEN